MSRARISHTLNGVSLEFTDEDGVRISKWNAIDTLRGVAAMLVLVAPDVDDPGLKRAVRAFAQSLDEACPSPSPKRSKPLLDLDERGGAREVVRLCLWRMKKNPISTRLRAALKRFEAACEEAGT